MDNRYRKKILHLERFQAWEKDYQKGLSMDKKLRQFEILYQAGRDMFSSKLEEFHRRHLSALIEVQKHLRVKGKLKE